MSEFSPVLSEMTMDDYDDIFSLWKTTASIGLSDGASREGTAAYLRHNPGLSVVVRQNGRLIGALLCGHDGRRAYFHHLVAASDFRHRGIGRKLVDECLARAAAQGILKAHAWVYCENQSGLEFWKQIGWTCRTELQILSRLTGQG
jgi:ribosomal protein S18 acetylase RimI-like enzyme